MNICDLAKLKSDEKTGTIDTIIATNDVEHIKCLIDNINNPGLVIQKITNYELLSELHIKYGNDSIKKYMNTVIGNGFASLEDYDKYQATIISVMTIINERKREIVVDRLNEIYNYDISMNSKRLNMLYVLMNEFGFDKNEALQILGEYDFKSRKVDIKKRTRRK